MTNDGEAELFEMMGYIAVEVDSEKGKMLIDQAVNALNHQITIAVLAEKELKHERGSI